MKASTAQLSQRRIYFSSRKQESDCDRYRVIGASILASSPRSITLLVCPAIGLSQTASSPLPHHAGHSLHHLYNPPSLRTSLHRWPSAPSASHPSHTPLPSRPTSAFHRILPRGQPLHARSPPRRKTPPPHHLPTLSKQTNPKTSQAAYHTHTRTVSHEHRKHGHVRPVNP